MRRKDTIEFLGLWESLNNMNFNSVEFDRIKSEAGYNSFTLSPKKWVEKTGAIGIISKGGRYGGAFAHTDIAFEFASWISAEFKMYVIQDYKRLKSDEKFKLSLGWNLNREISKINYKIHTDAIKEYLLKDLTDEQLSYKYASEADMLNVALFNKRAKQWREENPDLTNCFSKIYYKSQWNDFRYNIFPSIYWSSSLFHTKRYGNWNGSIAYSILNQSLWTT